MIKSDPFLVLSSACASAWMQYAPAMPKIWRVKFERGIDFDIERGQRSHTCLGETSAGKQAVETAAVAPGDHATFTAQGDAARRPAVPPEQLGADAETEPDPSSAWNWAFRPEMTRERRYWWTLKCKSKRHNIPVRDGFRTGRV